ncbi:MAG TPA: ABC transporter permease [Bryobacteraceae bacterium]|nr:ABC transporter permease [Bryobacteraceae bacterium]
MLNAILASHELLLGLAQALVAAALALGVALVARSRGIRLFSDTVISLVRGLTQMIAVGYIFVLLLRGPRWISPFVLAAMIVAAAATSSRRARGFPGAFRISLTAIFCGAGLVITVMTVLGAIDTAVSALIPVGSMLIANAMNANALALDRFRSEVDAHRGEIESALALGAAPGATVRDPMQNALRASLIPPIDNLRSLGIVWIPGLMAGMLLSKGSPVYASIYQFVVLAMILGSSGLTCMVSTWLMSQAAFSPAEQLVMRPAPVRAGAAGGRLGR